MVYCEIIRCQCYLGFKGIIISVMDTYFYVGLIRANNARSMMVGVKWSQTKRNVLNVRISLSRGSIRPGCALRNLRLGDFEWCETPFALAIPGLCSEPMGRSDEQPEAAQKVRPARPFGMSLPRM